MKQSNLSKDKAHLRFFYFDYSYIQNQNLIDYFMTLNEVKLNTPCLIKQINDMDEKTKIRLMELGIVENTKILVKARSVLKKTLLVVFNNSCFTIKENVASAIVVNYA